MEHEPSLFSVFLTALAGFFAISNPLAAAPIFIEVTRGADSATVRAVALRSVVVAFLALTTFAVLGKFILDAFSITLPAFRIAGGVVIFAIGFRMLEGQTSRVQTPSASHAEASREAVLGVAVSPLGVPMLTGPGSIASAMSFAGHGNVPVLAVTIFAFGVVCVIVYFFFLSSKKLMRFLGSNGLAVVSRLMGLILAVIGTQMVVEGIQGAFLLRN